MIYIDSSVALASLLIEARQPPDALWEDVLTSSRLFEFEVINRVHANAAGPKGVAKARDLIESVDLLELQPDILARALEPFPVPVRTLDGVHLATMVFLRLLGQPFELATYDMRLGSAASALGIPLAKI